MLTIEQEDQLIVDVSAALEEIHSASSIDEVYQRFLEAVAKVKSHNLHLLSNVTIDDFSEPGNDEEVEFVLPLMWTIAPDDIKEESDQETDLNLIFNYAKASGVYMIFADIDFYSDVVEQDDSENDNDSDDS